MSRIKLGLLLLASAGFIRPLAGGTADFKQAANDDAGFGLGNTHWIGSVLQDGNSTYYEGMSVLERALFTGVTATTGNHHSLLFRHQFTKGGQHGYDFLTSYAQAQADNTAALGVTTIVNPCGPDLAASVASVCSALQAGPNFVDVLVPADTFISKDGSTATRIAAYESRHGPRTVRIIGDAPISNAVLTVCHDVADGGDTSDSFALYALTWDSASTNILIQMAGHLAISGDGTEGTWGLGLGSGYINGGSFHFKLDSLGGALTDTNCPPGQNRKEIVSIGSQDNALQSTSIAPPAPPCNIAGLSAVCALSTNIYQAPSFGPNLAYTWSISGNAAILGTTTTSNVSVVAGNGGSCTLTVTITATTGPFTTNSTCSFPVLVHPLPPCGVSGSLTVCPASTNGYSGPAGMVGYSWSVNGGGIISGPAGSQSVAVGSSSNCNTNFALILTVTDTNGCMNTCTQMVVVHDIVPPTITCPPPFNAAESPRYSGGAIVNYHPLPTATDNCTANPTIFNPNPPGSLFSVGTNIVTATAVDNCNNSNSCNFVVRVIPYQLVVTTTNDSGPGSLRQALLDANDSPDENLVIFRLPGSGPFTISVQSALPEMTSPIIIDGWSQAGSNSSPVIEVVGPGSVDGLVVSAGSSTIRGLALHGFATAIRLVNAGNNVVQGNFIGTDLTGTNTAVNSANGIYLNSSGNLIGGIAAGTGNVISGNASNGIVLTSANARNNTVQGNLIGVGMDGVSALGNGGSGVFFGDQASNNLVGGTNNGAANIISFNGKAGITLDGSAGTSNGLLRNSIFSNASLAIDLGGDGVTPNHTNGPVAGPNNFQNFPVLSDVQAIEGITTVYGKLTGSPNTTYRIELYLDDNADPSGFGQGVTFIGATYVTTPDSGTGSFSAAYALNANFTQYITATATDPFNNTSEFSHAGRVRTPPILGGGPVSTNIFVGAGASFCASASGTPPILFQWRLNGWNIPGATNSCYTVPAAQLGQGGIYTVVIGNDLGAAATIPVSMTLKLITNAPGTNFAGRVTLSGTNFIITGSNRKGNSEPGEPLHAGQPGGKVVWYTWTAPITGVVTVQTSGSTFDTLLAIYTGSSLTNLVPVASDEGHGGFYTSRLLFNSFQGTQYQIAIDGFGGDTGDFILSWQEQNTSHMLPIFVAQPTTQVVAPGQNASFTALGARSCGNGQTNCNEPNQQLFYQWFYYGNPIAGATTNTLTLTNVQAAQVGTYFLQISTPYQTNQSRDVFLQINLTGSAVENALAADKLLDATLPVILGEGSVLVAEVSPNGGWIKPNDTTIVRGYTGTQIFNTTGSATGPGEVICGVIGGASDWISIVPVTSGMLYLNSDGSSYDTVMAVFRRSPTNASILQLVACDNNSGVNSLTSSTSFPVTTGQTNYIEVDGVNGASGTLQLNYSLVTSSIIKSAGMTPQGPHLQILGHTNMHFTLQASTNLVNWSSLITATATNTIFDYIDTTAANSPGRYYRAVMLP